MPSLFTWNWPALAAAGLFVAAVTLVVCKGPPCCRLGALPRQQAATSTSTLGEENMSATNAKSQIQHADDTTFGNLVLKSDVPVLVDFYADWCGPCRQLATLLEELAAETASVKIVKVNVDDSPALAQQYGVDSIPSLKVFNRGAVTDELVGLASKKELRALLTR